MAHIANAEVFALASSIFRSGYPMLASAPTEEEFREAVSAIDRSIQAGDLENPHIKRATSLANARGGGHDQFLTGITVTFDLTLSNKAWVEAERYTFLNFISSMSSMHRASVFPIGACCNAYVDSAAVKAAGEAQDAYNRIDGESHPEEKKEAYLRLLYNIPSGFELMAGMTTNYRCLKNIYQQRRNHRLPDWHVVCGWIESLPLAGQLITGKAVE